MAPRDTLVVAALPLAPRTLGSALLTISPEQMVESKGWGRDWLHNSMVEHLPSIHKVLKRFKKKKIYWPFYVTWPGFHGTDSSVTSRLLSSRSTKTKKGHF